MQAMDTDARAGTSGFHSAVRNRYYYGKLLDVVHFDIEQDYGNYKRWLINRAVIGCGVVCGLDVELSRDGKSVTVTRGLAFDGDGRELIVPSRSREIELPPPPESDSKQAPCYDDEGRYHLVICYHECPGGSDPGPGGDCGDDPCVTSLILEKYSLEWRAGRAPDVPHDVCVPELVSGERINRRALALHISRCPDTSCGLCIPLANVTIPKPGEGEVDIDITVRPIVYTNPLLYELITAMTSDRQNRGRVGK